MSLILPLLPYYARSFSASALLVGLLGTSNALAQVLGAPLIGRLSDRFGRRPLILVGTATAAGFVMLGFARSLRCCSRAASSTACSAATWPWPRPTSPTSRQESRRRSLGIIGAAFGIGFVIGPAAGGFLDRLGRRGASLRRGRSRPRELRLGARRPAREPDPGATGSARGEPAAAGDGRSPAPRAAPAGGRAAADRPAVLRALVRHLPVSFALWAAARLRLASRPDRRARLRRRAVRAGPGRGHRAPHAPVPGADPDRRGVAVLGAPLLWAFVPNVALLLVALAAATLGGGVANVTITASLTRAVAARRSAGRSACFGVAGGCRLGGGAVHRRRAAAAGRRLGRGFSPR